MDFSFWVTFQVDQFPHLAHLVTKVLCKGIVGTRTSLGVVLLKNWLSFSTGRILKSTSKNTHFCYLLIHNALFLAFNWGKCDINKINNFITHEKDNAPVMKWSKDNRIQQEWKIEEKMQECFQQKCKITRTRICPRNEEGKNIIKLYVWNLTQDL